MGVMPAHGSKPIEFFNTVCLTKGACLPPLSPRSEDDQRAKTDPCNASVQSWPDSEEDDAVVEQRRLSLLPGSDTNPCYGPPDCTCGCKDQVDAPPTAERPCLHNQWDDVRTRKSSKILRCRVCQRKWKLPSSNVPRCVGFLKGECDLGSKCDRLHVFKKKVAVEERVERFGPQILQAQAQLQAAGTTRRSSAPPAPLTQQIQQISPTAAGAGTIARRRSCFAPQVETSSPRTEPATISPGAGVSPMDTSGMSGSIGFPRGRPVHTGLGTPEARPTHSPASMCSAPTLQSGLSPDPNGGHGPGGLHSSSRTLQSPCPGNDPVNGQHSPGWSPTPVGHRDPHAGGPGWSPPPPCKRRSEASPRSDSTAPVEGGLHVIVPRQSGEEDGMGSRQSTGPQPQQPIYSPSPAAGPEPVQGYLFPPNNNAGPEATPRAPPAGGSPPARHARSNSRAGSDVFITVGDDGTSSLECMCEPKAMTETELDMHLSRLQALGKLPSGPK
eukprot:Hpha_TRINITY_DN15506_c7_g5::TRINITY_DN15506_c7_g5_i1::g.105737::m.105737